LLLFSSTSLSLEITTPADEGSKHMLYVPIVRWFLLDLHTSEKKKARIRQKKFSLADPICKTKLLPLPDFEFTQLPKLSLA
jgi:hypothetical protein